jgi:peroxiredoxin Q/BCP
MNANAISSGTKQACMFRDGYENLTSTGLDIYGLSTDSPKANTTFKTKQNLPYPLICDVNVTLIGNLGLKKSPKGTVRGVCVIDKTGKVLLLEPGSPAGTVEAVEKFVRENPVKDGGSEETKEEAKDEVENEE